MTASWDSGTTSEKTKGSVTLKDSRLFADGDVAASKAVTQIPEVDWPPDVRTWSREDWETACQLVGTL